MLYATAIVSDADGGTGNALTVKNAPEIMKTPILRRRQASHEEMTTLAAPTTYGGMVLTCRYGTDVPG